MKKSSVHGETAKLLAACGLLFLCSSALAAGAKRTFGGPVVETDKGHKWFVLQCASKRTPKPKVVVDKKTQWAGPAPKGNALANGTRVLVVGVEQADGSFLAEKVTVIVPEKAGTSGRSGSH